MNAVLSLGLGYLIGCISPAALLARLKNVNLKEEGTKNLGATNTALVLGRASGIFVMLFDILKSYFAGKLAKWFFPHLAFAGLLACIGTILGHCFPVFLNFQGGKGLATFGGLVLFYNPWFFLGLIVTGLVLMLIFNTGVVMPMYASVMFPILTWLYSGSLPDTLLAVLASGIIVTMHWSNLRKAREKKDYIQVKAFFRNILFKK